MISKQELKQILIIYEFPEEQINEIINKKIVLNQADAEMVCLNIEMLLSKGFSANRIAKCSSLLCIRKIQKIIEVYNTLNKYEIPKELIENYLYVLARGKASEIEEIFEVLYKHKISKETIEGCLSILARGKASEIEKIFEVLEKYTISKEAIEKCLSVLARGKAEEMEKVFEVLYKHKISKEAIEGCLSILAFGKASEIERIFEILYEKEISKEVIEKCLSVLARGKASEIERTFEILYKKEISKKAIERCFNVVVSGKASEIEKIFKVLYKYEISKETIERCLSVLAQGKASEIENILEVLDKHKISKETIRRSLNVLTRGKASEIEKIFEVLDKNEISKEKIEGCLSIFAYGKAKEIEKIFEVLYKNEISKEAIEGCIYVLAVGKASEIEKNLKKLTKYKISKNIIEKNMNILIKKSDEIEKIFKEDTSLETLKLFMKLKGFYNRIVTRNELKDICDIKNINIDQIFKYFFDKDSIKSFTEILNRTLIEKGGVYIGKSVEMNKEDIEKYSEQILKIAKNVSKSVGYKYCYNDINELESYCTYIIVNKCGDIVFNLSLFDELMESCIYKKTKKRCIGKILIDKKNTGIDFDLLKNTKLMGDKNKVYIVENELDIGKWKLDTEEGKIVKKLSKYLDSGYSKEEALKQVAEEMEIDMEELLGTMSEIKEKISKVIIEEER